MAPDDLQPESKVLLVSQGIAGKGHLCSGNRPQIKLKKKRFPSMLRSNILILNVGLRGLTKTLVLS